MPALSAVPERSWRRTVVYLFHATGWRVYWTWTSIHSPAGFPDLVACHPTHGVRFIELKTEKGRVSESQANWIAALRAAGQHVEVLKPSDWERAQAIARGERLIPAARAEMATPPDAGIPLQRDGESR